MKNILCYGDSNTNGCGCRTGMPRRERFNRWTGVLQKNLGFEEYYVIEDGLNGRSTHFSHPTVRHTDGYETSDVAVTNTFPLDLVIIMLGTNDLAPRYGSNVYSAAGWIMRIMANMRATAFETGNVVPKFLVIAPPPLGEAAKELDFTDDIIEESKNFSRVYREMAEIEGAYFFDAAPITKTGYDGIHFDDESHFALGNAITGVVRDILK